MDKKTIKNVCLMAAHNINRDIFDGTLPPVKIKVKKELDDNAFAWYCDGVIQISMSQHADCWTGLLSTMAHEMIHHAQDYWGLQNDKGHDSLNHNGAFFRYFANKICNEYGYNRERF